MVTQQKIDEMEYRLKIKTYTPIQRVPIRDFIEHAKDKLQKQFDSMKTHYSLKDYYTERAKRFRYDRLKRFRSICPTDFTEDLFKTMPKTDIKEVLTERGINYGEFPQHAEITQALKDVMVPYRDKLSNSQKECLEMVFHKIGRILNGEPDYLDSWVDIIGYVQLVINELEDEASVVTSEKLEDKANVDTTSD